MCHLSSFPSFNLPMDLQVLAVGFLVHAWLPAISLFPFSNFLSNFLCRLGLLPDHCLCPDLFWSHLHNHWQLLRLLALLPFGPSCSPHLLSAPHAVLAFSSPFWPAPPCLPVSQHYPSRFSSSSSCFPFVGWEPSSSSLVFLLTHHPHHPSPWPLEPRPVRLEFFIQTQGIWSKYFRWDVLGYPKFRFTLGAPNHIKQYYSF